MNLVLRLLGTLTVKPLYNVRVIRLSALRLGRLSLLVADLTGLVETGDFGGCKRFGGIGGREIFWMREGEVVILQLIFDVEFVELVIDGVV